MTKEFTKEERLDALKKLPEKAQDYILSERLSDAYKNIIDTQGLRVDEGGIVAEETSALMVGLTSPDVFMERLRKRLLNMDKVRLLALTNAINMQVLGPLREHLKETWRTVDVKTPKEETASTQTPQKQNMVAADDTGVRFADEEVALPGAYVPEQKTKELDQDLAGLKRSMPRDVEHAQQKEKVAQPKTEQKEFTGPFAGTSKIIQEKMTKQTSSSEYKGVDPYREPIE